MSEQEAGSALDTEIFTRVFGEAITCSHGSQCSDIPPFSTDLDSAWLLVERANDYQLWSGGHYRDEPSLVGSSGRLHVAELWFAPAGTAAWDRLRMRGRGTGPTLPLAICRAALSVLEHVPPSEQGRGREGR